MNDNDPGAPALELVECDSASDLPPWATLDRLVDFLHHEMKPYHDTLTDVRRGLEYAFSNGAKGRDGFAVLAGLAGELAGAVVFLKTGMGGYVPENLLLFVAVDPEKRNRGIGGALIERALSRCEGDVKLHVEYDNPAGRLYERLGFESKYKEMRYTR